MISGRLCFALLLLLLALPAFCGCDSDPCCEKIDGDKETDKDPDHTEYDWNWTEGDTAPTDGDDAFEDDGESELSDDAEGEADDKPFEEDIDGIPNPNPFIPFQGGFYSLGEDQSQDDEKPVHQVTMSRFEIQKYEVTVREYQTCVKLGFCSPRHYATIAYDNACNYGNENRINRPMNCVGWDGAMEYCAMIEALLPTEAQWEIAARGSERRAYPWGEQPATCERAQMHNNDGDGCGTNTTAVYNQFSGGATPEAVYNLSGNVAEWVYDWYSENYSWCLDCTNPSGPADSPTKERVLRGGSYKSGPSELRGADRQPVTGFDVPGSFPHAGFRCARTLEEGK